MLKVFIILGVALVVPVFFVITWIVSTYNKLLVLRARLKTAYAQLHAHMKHRSDLVPDLIELAKTAFKEDLSLLQGLAGARIPAATATSQTDPKKVARAAVKQLSTADRGLQDSLQKFFLSAEQKPDLRSQTLYLNLKEDLAQTDKAIINARETYNQAVVSYNELTRRFPALIIARVSGFEVAEPF